MLEKYFNRISCLFKLALTERNNEKKGLKNIFIFSVIGIIHGKIKITYGFDVLIKGNAKFAFYVFLFTLRNVKRTLL